MRTQFLFEKKKTVNHAIVVPYHLTQPRPADTSLNPTRPAVSLSYYNTASTATKTPAQTPSHPPLLVKDAPELPLGAPDFPVLPDFSVI